MKKDALRSAAEALINKENRYKGENLNGLSLKEIQSIVHDLEVHQVELEMQNDELRRIQSELEHLKARYFDIYDLAPEGYLILSEKGFILESNLTAAEMIGEQRGHLVKQMLARFVCIEDLGIYYNHRKRAFKSLQPEQCELRMVKRDGSLFWSHMKSVVVMEEGQPVCRMVLSDISDRKKAEGELLFLSYHDPLTGLHNRRYFEEKLKILDTRENLPLSIIMCDINGLKVVNDSFGHHSGDMLLKKAGETIKRACREADVIARIGGDEFVVLLPNTSLFESAEVASRIKELEEKETVANIRLSISFGYDTKTMEEQSIVEIFAKAENQMYRHKLLERSNVKGKTTDSIMKELFKKSERESEHSSRVSRISQSIAAMMHLDEDAVDQIKVAGIFHDIGKTGIEKGTLTLAGALSLEERSDMERHPEIGWRLLKSTNEFSDLAQTVLNHHEKWDGSGYPNGLKGKDSQLAARIIAVAEAYDAMTSETSYHKPMSKKDAVRELERCAGTQFDPEIVDVLVNQVLSEYKTL